MVSEQIFNGKPRDLSLRSLDQAYEKYQAYERIHNSDLVGRKEFEKRGMRPCLKEHGSIEDLFNTVFESRFPRLSRAREFFGTLQQGDLPMLSDVFKVWQKYDCYLFLKGTHRETGKKQFLLSKCAKRGNDVFNRRVENRLGFLRYGDNVEFFNYTDFEEDKKATTRLLWVTLTFDSKQYCLDDAWRGRLVEKVKIRGKNKGDIYLAHSKECRCIQCSFNLWITNLRNKYGKISYVSFVAPFPNKDGKAFGYPHIHLILLFDDVEFNVFQSWERDRENKLGIVYRIQEKDELHDQGKWDAFIDVKAIASLSSLFNYAKKHFLNDIGSDSDKANTNNSVLWFYRKKSFNLSGVFRERLSSYIDLIITKHNSKPFQALLDGGGPVRVWDWFSYGVFSAKRVGKVVDLGDPPAHFISLDPGEAGELLESWCGNDG